MKINKSLIRLFAFLSACIIFVSSVLYNGLNVFADSNVSLTSVLSISDICVTKTDYDINYLYSSNSAEISTWSLCVQSGFNVPEINITNNPNYQDNFRDYFACARSNSNTGFGIYLIPDSSFIILYPNGAKIYYSVQPSYSNGSNIFPYFFNNSGVFTGSDGLNTTGSVVIDGVTYYSRDVDRLISASVPVYTKDTNGDPSSLSECGSNINTNVGNGGESSNNNLYLVNSDFSFSNTKFVAPYSSVINTGGIYPNGSITFSGIPNEYQVEHKSDFTITFGFQFRYNVTYQNQGSSDFGPFKTTSTLLNTKKKYCTTLHYSNNGIESIDVPLTQFISNGNSVSWTMEEILSHMTNDFDYSTLLSQSKELTSVEYNAFDIVCNAYISSGVDSSGEYSEWYNPMSNKGYTTSENMKINKNPYTPSADNQGDQDYYGELNAPGSAGNSSSGSNDVSVNGGNATATNGGTSITINNNPTFNNENGGSSSSGSGSGGSTSESGLALTFFNIFNPFKLIFNKMTGDSELVADDTLEEIGANSFITFLSDTFSFIPEQIWSKLAWYVGASLTILIIACILRVILDLL